MFYYSWTVKRRSAESKSQKVVAVHNGFRTCPVSVSAIRVPVSTLKRPALNLSVPQVRIHYFHYFNPLNAELNPICHLLALVGAHHIVHVSRVRVNCGVIISIPSACTGWTVRGSIPGGGDVFCTRPDRPCGSLDLLYNTYWVTPRSKAAGAWLWSRTPSSAEVKERVGLRLFSPPVPSWQTIGWTSPLLLFYALYWRVAGSKVWLETRNSHWNRWCFFSPLKTGLYIFQSDMRLCHFMYCLILLMLIDWQSRWMQKVKILFDAYIFLVSLRCRWMSLGV